MAAVRLGSAESDRGGLRRRLVWADLSIIICAHTLLAALRSATSAAEIEEPLTATSETEEAVTGRRPPWRFDGCCVSWSLLPRSRPTSSIGWRGADAKRRQWSVFTPSNVAQPIICGYSAKALAAAPPAEVVPGAAPMAPVPPAPPSADPVARSTARLSPPLCLSRSDAVRRFVPPSPTSPVAPG